MQRDCGDKEKEKNDDPHIGEESEDDSSERFLVHAEEMHHPAGSDIPENQRRAEEKERNNDSDHKHAKEQVRRKMIFSRSIDQFPIAYKAPES